MLLQGLAPPKCWGDAGSHPRPYFTGLGIRDGSPHSGPESRQRKLLPAFLRPCASGVRHVWAPAFEHAGLCLLARALLSFSHWESFSFFMAIVCSSLGIVFTAFFAARYSGKVFCRDICEEPWRCRCFYCHAPLWSKPNSVWVLACCMDVWGSSLGPVETQRLQDLGTAMWLFRTVRGKQNRTWKKPWFCKQTCEQKPCPRWLCSLCTQINIGSAFWDLHWAVV